MTLALDTDVLVAWTFTSHPAHRAVVQLLHAERSHGDLRLGLTPQVLFEFLHVATDPGRFSAPLSVESASSRVFSLWTAVETVQILPDTSVPHRVAELLQRYRLGRKRILDTALAATLEAAGVRRLATLNVRDFAIFPFLTMVEWGSSA